MVILLRKNWHRGPPQKGTRAESAVTDLQKRCGESIKVRIFYRLSSENAKSRMFNKLYGELCRAVVKMNEGN